MTMTADLSVVIVTYNSASDIERCLDSLPADNQELALDILVVDNASSDATLELIRARYPRVALTANEKNTGFGAANNQAMRECSSELILLLNPDTEVAPGALETMMEFMNAHAECGCCGPMLVDENGVEAPAVAMPDALGLMLNTLKLKGAENRKVPTVLSGACLMLRSELLERVGYLDEQFFWCEDVDYCLRVLAAGYTVMSCKQAVVRHFSGQSAKSNQKLHMYAMYSSKVRFAYKHLSGLKRAATFCWLCLEIVLSYLKCQFAATVLRGGVEEAGKAEGLRAVLWRLPLILQHDYASDYRRFS
jgi:hypothetical protein